MFKPPFVGKKPTLLLHVRDEAGNVIEIRGYANKRSAESCYYGLSALGTPAAPVWYSQDADMMNVRAVGEDVKKWESILHNAEFKKMGTVLPAIAGDYSW